MKDILVSVLVLTYNSSKYLLPLLDSIAAQSYERIELVVADDGSKDESVRLAEKWVKEQEGRFEGCSILAPKENRGTVANVNAGYRECHGEYIKVIAGDDLLTANCVEDLVTACEESGRQVLVGDVAWVKEDGVSVIPMEENKELTAFYQMSAEEQHSFLLHKNCLPAPGEIFRKSLLDEVGGFDESFRLIEDYPMWLKLTGQGIAIGHVAKTVVLYRQNQNSVANAGANHRIYNALLIADSEKIFYKLRKKELAALGEKAFLKKTEGILKWRSRAVRWGNDDRKFFCKIALKMMQRYERR